MLVVVIVGMISAVAVPSLMRTRDAADSAVAVGQLRTIHTTQSIYRTQRSRYARLGELNIYANQTLGKTVGSTLRHRDFVFLMSPSPTDINLRSGYTVIAYRVRNGRVISQYNMSEDGQIQTVLR